MADFWHFGINSYLHHCCYHWCCFTNLNSNTNFINKTHDNASLNVQLLQKEIFETLSKNLSSSTNLKTLAEQLADQLSGLDPCRWFQNITHSIGSGTVILVIVLTIIFFIYRCLHAKIVKTKQTLMVGILFTNNIDLNIVCGYQ